MMILYLSSNVYMVGQKGMWWKYNFDLVQMRGDIATKQLGRLIRFLYPHFLVISYACSPNHEGLMAPSGNASMRCPVGRAGAAPLTGRSVPSQWFLWCSATTKARGNLWFHNVSGKWRHVLLHSGRVSLWHPGDTWHIVDQGMSCTVHNVPCFSLVPWC